MFFMIRENTIKKIKTVIIHYSQQIRLDAYVGYLNLYQPIATFVDLLSNQLAHEYIIKILQENHFID